MKIKLFSRTFKIEPWTLFVIGAVLFLFIYFFFLKDGKKHDFVGLSKDLLSLLKKKRRIQKKNEQRCREVLERIYQAPFSACRPSFLKSPWTGRNLELDCYNPNMKLAAEYDGQQHYKYTPYFHRKGEYQFHEQVKRDKWKEQKCKELGITLIRIPYTVKYRDLERFIKKELKKHGKL